MRGTLAVLILLAPHVASAQFLDAPPSGGTTSGRASTTRLKVGVIVRASGGALSRAIATAPVPMNWPEQSVEIANEEFSSAVERVSYRDITGGGALKQMVVEIPMLPAGQEAKALVTFIVTRTAQVPPSDTAAFRIPKKLDRDLSVNIGTSPYIESRHAKIVSAAKQAVGDAQSDWQKVEAIYNWVRENVAHKHGELKGAARALLDKEAHTDDLTSLFIAMCRVHKIPARTVFEYGHCYAEFYLEDADGQGHWFCCQPAGRRAFGGLDDPRPILQKGDNFKNPENTKERQRFVTEYFKASGRGGEPKVTFVCEIVAE